MFDSCISLTESICMLWNNKSAEILPLFLTKVANIVSAVKGTQQHRMKGLCSNRQICLHRFMFF